MAVKGFLKSLVLLSVVMSCCCYIYLVPAGMGKSPDHDGYCIHSETETLVKQNDFVLTPRCEKVSCHDDYGMSIVGCGTFSMDDPNCVRYERDYSKPYPICCNTFICVEFNKTPVDLSTDDVNYLN